MCPNCKHTLAWYDLLPVVSWVIVAGKCRYCKKPISLQYPLVEVLTAFLFVLSYTYWPHGISFTGGILLLLWLVILVILVALAVYDLKWMLLPNKLIYPLIAVCALSRLVYAGNYWNPTLQGFWGVVCLAGLFYALFQISGGKWIGGGDVKLAVALGLLVGGPVEALLLLFVASLLGSVVTIPLIVIHKKRYSSRVPFGPFLIVATVIVYIFGATLINWYKNQFLLL